MYKSKIKEKVFKTMNENRKKVEGCSSATEFWKFVKSKYNNKTCVNNISSADWKTYFEELLNSKNDMDPNFETYVTNYVTWHDNNCIYCVNDADNANNADPNYELNRTFTISEIDAAIDELVIGTAPGIDGISNRILIEARIVIVPLLYRLFNSVLEKSYFPEQWGRALIVPIHKTGSLNDPNNYRGISLLSCVGKLFTKLINKRLTKWAADYDKISEFQSGFTKGKSTIDNIFVLQGMISKYLSRKGGRFYSVYVDFSKAFDTIPHLQLFYRLIREGLHGKVIKVLRNMYCKLSSCVEVFNVCDSQSSTGSSISRSLTEAFSCGVGTRQGCMISPFLFIFYIDELIKHVNENKCRGIYVDENNSNVSMLLYADDLVIVGDRIGDIQRLLNNLSSYCLKWGLTVNMEKTRFMVFRNGGIIRSTEKVYFNGIRIPTSPYYKYLGLLVSSRLSWTPAQKTLSLQAEKSMNLIRKVNYDCNFSFLTSSELFDKCILPIITYGCEIWGLNVDKSIENVLLKYCRHQMGVGSKSPSPAVLGECGRQRVYVICYYRCIKYWLKILYSQSGSLLESSYKMLYNLCNAGRQNWASDIRDILYKFGFGYVWEMQGVDDKPKFLREFKKCVRDCEFQNWNESMFNMSKLRSLHLYKSELTAELYLYLYLPQRLRSALAKFRISSHELAIEKGRHNNVAVDQRFCQLCISNNNYFIEDEYHVLLKCPFYQELRTVYLNMYIDLPVNLYTFTKIMSSKDNNELSRLALYIANMFKLRNYLLMSL